MFSKICAAHLKIPRLLRVMAWAAIFLTSIGIILNVLVILTNGGKMPVAMQKVDILFVIGPAQLGVDHFVLAEDFDHRHQALTKRTRLRILADRIPISFHSIPPGKLPRWCHWALNRMQITAGEDGIASIGDLLLWLGLLLTFPALPLLFMHLVGRIYQRFTKGT